MADALKFANERLARAALRLKNANEELVAAEHEHGIAANWVRHLETHQPRETEPG